MFDDVRLPTDVEKGSSGGPEFFTSILSLANGAEARNQNWQNARMTFDISYGITQDTYLDVIAFFRARRGRLRGFRYKDWTDYQGFAETMLGVVDGTNTTFQLVKNYDDGVVQVTRRITRPVAGTLIVYENGIATNGYTLNALGSVVFNTAPVVGTVVSADYEFDVPVRFDNDQLSLTVQTWQAAEVGSINLVELAE